MQEYEILNQIYHNIENSSYIEIIAVFFGLLSVWFARKENILVFPFGLINVGLYVYIYLISGLYAAMSINSYFVIMSFYGWYFWSKKDSTKKNVPISYSTKKGYLIAAALFTLSFAIIYYVLKNYTDSTVPILDSLTTSLFVVGMWMQTRKKIENWLFWIIGDTLSIPMVISKGLYFSGLQYLVFMMIGISGFIEWRKKYYYAKNKKNSDNGA